MTYKVVSVIANASLVSLLFLLHDLGVCSMVRMLQQLGGVL